ncbi:MAG: hypothetical protein SynsKO_44590 [Synoicihabitans sp.]
MRLLSEFLRSIGWMVLCGGTIVVSAGDQTGQVSVGFDAYGGNRELVSEATGFFRLQEFAGRHFLVTPYGHGYRALGLNHFHNMTSPDHDGAIDNIREWGFNAGCYQGPRWMWQRYPYTKGINLVPICQWLPDDRYGYRDVFDPEFLVEMDEHIRSIVEPQKNNRMLIGYFWTDIPNWERQRNGEDWISFYRGLPANSPGGQAWRHWRNENASAPPGDFLAIIARQLYGEAHATLRKYDSNHLILGPRYHEIDMPEHVVREVLPYVDALAIQPTSREFNTPFFDEVYAKFGKPIYIADHVSSFRTADHPITMGQAADNAADYSFYYQRYVVTALSQPYMIGYNKCQYQDQMAPDGIMLKQGILGLDESPYEEIIPAISLGNRQALEAAYRLE